MSFGEAADSPTARSTSSNDVEGVTAAFDAGVEDEVGRISGSSEEEAPKIFSRFLGAGGRFGIIDCIRGSPKTACLSSIVGSVSMKNSSRAGDVTSSHVSTIASI